MCEDVLAKTAKVLPGKWVDAARCLRTSTISEAWSWPGKVMIELTSHGIGRDEAHEILRTASFTAVETGEHLMDICMRTPEITAVFSVEDLERCSIRQPIGVSGELVDEAVELARQAIA
ncbi:MAG: hypothetical protein CM15mP18_4910 [Methanobacteriota archaeon]|nr:MAG: hypothetical protein CM15mP18_4910 [Euryarchaeota archaeon]